MSLRGEFEDFFRSLETVDWLRQPGELLSALGPLACCYGVDEEDALYVLIHLSLPAPFLAELDGQTFGPLVGVRYYPFGAREAVIGEIRERWLSGPYT